jgi:hypothetical protein
VLAREYPSCDRREKRRAVIDLLAFDSESNNRLVELKQAKATDTLFGVVLEALDTWIFFTRNSLCLAAVFGRVGWRCEDISARSKKLGWQLTRS